mgnify:CR=1 FL=1
MSRLTNQKYIELILIRRDKLIDLNVPVGLLPVPDMKGFEADPVMRSLHSRRTEWLIRTSNHPED